MAVWSICQGHTFSRRCLATCLLICFLLPATVTSTPVNGCADFVNKNGVNVHNCSGRDLNELPKKLSEMSEVLDFSWNKLTELPFIPESNECVKEKSCPQQNSTYHCRQELLFSRNQIYTLAKDALHGLRCLRTLDLSFNEIRGDIFHTNTFQEGAYHLQRLLLNNNPLGSLPDNVITQPFMHDLRELDLSHCDLEKLGPNAVDDFGELTILNLSFNQLKEIHSDTFKGLSKLEYLDLRENQLTYFPEHIFGDLGNLKVLLLSDNKIKGFNDHAFYRGSSLEVLGLRNNQLTSVPYTTLDKLTVLRTLDLSQNPIRQVVRGAIISNVQNLALDNMPELTELGSYALSSFPALVSLSISGNKALEKIHRQFLGDNFPTLKQVTLVNNKLSTIASDSLPWKQLEKLEVGGNPWFCDDGLEWMIRATSIQSEVKCAEPLQLKGHDIRTLNSDDLAKDYSLQMAAGVISLFVCLPVFGVCAVLIWRRRRYCPCVKVTLKGQYVTLFTRDIDHEGEQTVTVELKANANKLNAVSNGAADHTIPFIKLHKGYERLKEEPDFEMD